jgi:hypothetical protein
VANVSVVGPRAVAALAFPLVTGTHLVAVAESSDALVVGKRLVARTPAVD